MDSALITYPDLYSKLEQEGLLSSDEEYEDTQELSDPFKMTTPGPQFTAEQMVILFDRQCKREDAKALAEEMRAQQLHDAQMSAMNKLPEKQTEGTAMEFEDEGELTEETRLLQKHLPGIKRSYLVAIVKNKFPAENLCKLVPGSVDSGSTGVTTELLGGRIITRRVRETTKSYGHDMTIWTAGFLKYICALGILYPTEHMLPMQMIMFLAQIHEFEKDYKQSAILGMVLEFHNTLIDEQKYITPTSWILPLEVQYRHLNYAQVKGAPARNTGRQTGSLAASGGTRTHEENNPSVTCAKFHTPTGCNYRGCKRFHQRPCTTVACSGAHTTLT